MNTFDQLLSNAIPAMRSLQPNTAYANIPSEVRSLMDAFPAQKQAYNPAPGIALTIPTKQALELTRDITTSAGVPLPKTPIEAKARDTAVFKDPIGVPTFTVNRGEGQIGYPCEGTAVEAVVITEGSGVPSEAGATVTLQARPGHQLAGYVNISRLAKNQVEGIIQSVSAIGIESIRAKAAQQLLAGSGSNEMLGLVNDTALTAVNLSTLNADKLADLIEAAGFGDERDLRCIIAGGAANTLRQRDLSVGTSGVYAIRNGMLDGAIPTVTSSHMSSGTLVLGDFKNACALIIYGGIDVWIDPYTYGSKGTVRVIFYALVDSVVLQRERIIRGTSIS